MTAQELAGIIDLALRRREKPPPRDQEDEDEDRTALEALIEASSGRLVLITQRLTSGEIDVDEWRMLFELEVRALHLLSAVLGVGGPNRLTFPDVVRVERLIADELRYLSMWRNTLTSPTPRAARVLNEGRAKMYARAAYGTFERFFSDALGLPDLPFYPGDRTKCMRNCRCRWEYHKLDGDNWDVYWRRAADDSCATCIRREMVCAPLMIRDGIILPFDETGTLF